MTYSFVLFLFKQSVVVVVDVVVLNLFLYAFFLPGAGMRKQGNSESHCITIE